MNFTLHQLRLFLEIAEHQNITKAAEALYMTQPALSIQLKNFQSQFDVPLTERIGKKLHLTDFGESIAEVARKMLSHAEEINYKTKQYQGLLTGRLRISSASTGKYVIPTFLNSFIQQYPGIDLTLDVSNKTTVLRSLQNNEVDFALVSVVPEKLDVHEEFLVKNELYLIGNDTEFNDDRPLIYREHGSATRGVMDEYFKDNPQRKSMELTSNEAVKQAVIAGLGYSILPKIGIKNELSLGQLHIIPSEGLPITTHWRLIWLRNKQLSPVANAYLSYIQENKAEIIQSFF